MIDPFLGYEDSYIRKIYQLFTSLRFQTDNQDQEYWSHNQLTVR